MVVAWRIDVSPIFLLIFFCPFKLSAFILLLHNLVLPLQQAHLLLLHLAHLVHQSLHLSKASFGLYGFRHNQALLPLGCLLLLVLLLVKLLEVLSNDGDGQRHDKHPRDGAQGSDQLAKAGGGRHVAVTHGGHRDHDPVEGVGDGGVLGLLLLSLDEVAEGGEEEASDADEEDEQAELLVAVLQRERN